MSLEVQSLLETLSPPERLAVEILKTTLDCYNSKDGIGMFSGIERYQKLTSRLEIAAVQSRNPVEFWGILLRRMMWPTPPARMDESILNLLKRPEAVESVNCIARNSAALVMVARYWHTGEKKNRINEYKQIEEGIEEKGEKQIETLFN